MGRGDHGAYHLQRLVTDRPEPDYWPRVWAARALLYGWTEDAVAAVITGLGDPHWRVREMCAKVCARHRVDATAELTTLLDDPVARVRTAAQRALQTADDA